MAGNSAGHGSFPGRQWMQAAAMDEEFNASTLLHLRNAVLAVAVNAGMPDDRASEVMLAVHELAANSVVHGGGAGRVRMRVVAGELQCQVSDAAGGSLGGHDRSGADEAPSWPVESGHGLWLVRKTADHVSIASRPGGSEVTAAFRLPGFHGDRAGD